MAPNAFTDSWEPCPSGELTGMVQRAQSVRRKSQTTSFTIVGVLVLTSCLSLLYLQFSTPSANAAGLACFEVQPLLGEYHQQKLTPAMSQRIDEHLAFCAHCREQLEAIQNGTVDACCGEAAACATP
ncbi:zf-HC2 domain-containing protein [Lignipirellula cremea]|uniref:Putative zinc-finger domain-containing protein n=1 Tax=Lignipirellula cremea TaxID=2528010 RepID=A0A518E1F5_9BACT|nr:zf-HC2 domain-containing protein [Lignipirellula cremea]QDU97904.1 hypothetical protein Pla8534_57620 [Lignipirellula cremea]